MSSNLRDSSWPEGNCMVIHYLHKLYSFINRIWMTANKFLQRGRWASTNVPCRIQRSGYDQFRSKDLENGTLGVFWVDNCGGYVDGLELGGCVSASKCPDSKAGCVSDIGPDWSTGCRPIIAKDQFYSMTYKLVAKRNLTSVRRINQLGEPGEYWISCSRAVNDGIIIVIMLIWDHATLRDWRVIYKLY